MSEYEADRAANIIRNKKLLESLGLDKPLFEPKEKIQKDKKTRKRQASVHRADEPKEPRAKVSRTDSDDAPTGARRSQRNAGKKVDYTSEQIRSLPVPASVQSGLKDLDNLGPIGRNSEIRIHDPKTYGNILGVPVGTWWQNRQGASIDAIHAPLVGGISVGKQGAYSVALSGGYDDDVDLGYAFTYTGSGGRDLKGTKAAPKNLRTAPQSSDQSFDNRFNKALQISSETHKPIRVLRGYKLKSPYGPSEGYRYDGLYRIEKAWIEKGLNPQGYLVCKFAFKRIEGQPPLPRRDIGTQHQQSTDNEYLAGVSERESS